MKKFYLLFAFFLASLTTSIHAQITCDFDSVYTGARCAPYVVIDTARNTSPFPISERRWYLTGTRTFTVVNGGLNPTFSSIIDTCGNYCLRIWAINSNGDTCSRTKCFTVGCNPTCNLSFSPTQGCAPLNVLATVNCTPGSGSVTALQIDWGCGLISSFANCPSTPVAHIYNCIPGSYSPVCIVRNSFGCVTNDANYLNAITITPSPIVANFTANDTFGCKVPHCVTYTATPCVGCSYTWSLPGAIPNSPMGNPVTVCYNIFGSFPASLTVRDTASGCQNSSSKFNYIKIREINPLIGTNDHSGCAPLCVTYKDITNYSLIPDAISNVCWSLPDSGIMVCGVDTLRKCFTTPGCYDTRLIVSTTTGCIDTTTFVDAVCVGIPPACSVTVFPDTMCFQTVPVTVVVNCDSFHFLVVDWGDGNRVTWPRDSGIILEHFYEDTGCMTTTITPYNDSCAGNTMSFTVCVLPPFAKFSPLYSCQSGDTVCLVNQSGPATSYKWHFCNGDSSILRNPPCLLLPPCDTCRVTLEAFSNVNGCSHTATKIINTACFGQASISPSNANVCARDTVVLATFTNTSVSIIATRWDRDTLNGGIGPRFSLGGTTASFFYLAPGQYTIAMENTSPGGCVDTAYANLKICKPIAEFSNNHACFPDSICFTDLTIDAFCNITYRRWSLGDGTIDTVSLNPCHKYDTSGVYTVKLFVRNDMGCRDSITHTVIVSDSVHLNYAIDEFMCAGTTHCITNNSTGIALTYHWNIPGAIPANGTNFTDPAPCYTINTNGDYWVHVTVSSNNLCATVDSTLVHICSPLASGTVSNNYFACPDLNQPVQFVSTSQCADWVTWNFGDQTYSNIDTVSHFYGYPGCYPITLTACNGTCCDTTIIDTICIGGPHITDYSASPSLMCACDDTVHFSFGTIEASSLILLYGCNQGIVQVNPITPIGTTQNPTYFDFYWPYCLTDSCPPQMIVGDSNGCITFFRFPAIYIDSADADFTSNTFGVCGSGYVCFNDNTHYTFPQSHTVQWLWSFGDGVKDTIENPCHYYSTQGTYTITLRVVSNAGCIDSVSKQITIHGYPTANFGFVATDYCNRTAVCFHDSSSADSGGVLAGWMWCFGDTSICDTSRANVCHTFTSEVNYEVVVTVVDENGCADSDTSLVTANFVITSMHAAFVYSATNGFVQFTNTSSGNFISVHWNFGDGGSSTQINTAHPYNASGNYPVTLTITDANGCMDDTTIFISVVITSINEIANEVDVKVIPNPFSDFTNIQITGAEGEYSFRVFNLVGTEITNVKLKSSELFKLYRDKLASGLYLFEVRANNKLLKRGKIVLQ